MITIILLLMEEWHVQLKRKSSQSERIGKGLPKKSSKLYFKKNAT
jgi:hypothetical protein